MPPVGYNNAVTYYMTIPTLLSRIVETDMEKPKIFEIIRLVQLQLGQIEVNEDDRLVEDLGAESADIANIVASAEEKFAITFLESEIATIRTSLDLYHLVSVKRE